MLPSSFFSCPWHKTDHETKCLMGWVTSASLSSQYARTWLFGSSSSLYMVFLSFCKIFLIKKRLGKWGIFPPTSEENKHSQTACSFKVMYENGSRVFCSWRHRCISTFWRHGLLCFGKSMVAAWMDWPWNWLLEKSPVLCLGMKKAS